MVARPSLPVPRILTLRRAAVTALFAAAILGGALLGVFFAFESDLPQVTSLEDYQPNIITQVFSADGSVLGEFAIEKRVVVAFPDIPPVLRNAIVSVEDADFWKHIGVNVWRGAGGARAALRPRPPARPRWTTPAAPCSPATTSWTAWRRRSTPPPKKPPRPGSSPPACTSAASRPRSPPPPWRRCGSPSRRSPGASASTRAACAST